MVFGDATEEEGESEGVIREGRLGNIACWMAEPTLARAEEQITHSPTHSKVQPGKDVIA